MATGCPNKDIVNGMMPPEAQSVDEEEAGLIVECTRCHSVMVKERLCDVLENDGQVYVSGWRWVDRCVACGNVSEYWDVDQNWQMAAHSATADQPKRNAKHADVGQA